MGCNSSKVPDSIASPTPIGAGTAQFTRAKSHLQENLCEHQMISDINTVYTINKELGQGGFGSVSLAKHKTTGREVALKTITLDQHHEVKQLRNEIQMLRTLEHPNIVRLLGIYETSTKMYLAMELCRGGDVLDELHAEKKIKEGQVKSVIMKLLSALSHLHSLGIIHRDIKLENLLFNDRSATKEIMLCDFGMGKKFEKGRVLTGNAEGSIYYVAPEVLMGEYTEACDLWSVGIATYMLLSGRTPFKGQTDEETVQKIVEAELQFDEQYWQGVSQESRQFILSLLKKEPSARLTADQALTHSWFKDMASTPRNQSTGPRRTSMIRSMQKFSEFSEMKKTAMLVIAFLLNPEEMAQRRQAFFEIDLDKTGTIKVHELKASLVQSGISEAEAESIFKAIDLDHTGRVNYLEFMASTIPATILEDEGRMKEAFDRMDTDASGYITPENLQEILGTDYNKENVKQMIEAADYEHDGRISYEEFKRLIRGEKTAPEVDEEVRRNSMELKLDDVKLATGA